MKRRLPKTLSVEEVRDLFRAMDGTSRVDRRNKVLFHLCYVAGLRIGEAVSLRLSNLDLYEGTMRVVGKGDKGCDSTKPQADQTLELPQCTLIADEYPSPLHQTSSSSGETIPADKP